MQATTPSRKPLRRVGLGTIFFYTVGLVAVLAVPLFIRALQWAVNLRLPGDPEPSDHDYLYGYSEEHEKELPKFWGKLTGE